MSCNFPVYTYRKDGSITQRPCSQCMSCRIDKSKEWAIRCVHESQLHEQNSFITLTYNDENLPTDGSIQKLEMQNFMKKLRSDIEPQKVRFFGCGEYGETTFRPHYHLCLFGYDFDDKEIFFNDPKKVSRKRFRKGHDHTVYTSERLQRLWPKGFHTIGELTYESAAYVARYVTKKVKGSSPEAIALFKQRYGNKEPEFALMSRMPGLGQGWVQKYYSDIYPKDFVTINGIKFKPPRYYDSIYSKLCPNAYQELKNTRRENEKLSDLPADEACSHENFKHKMLERQQRSI